MSAAVCKANYAVDVKTIMPLTCRMKKAKPAICVNVGMLTRFKLRFYLRLLFIARLHWLDNFTKQGIMYFTISRNFDARGRHDKIQTRRHETQGAPRLSCCQSSSSKGHRRAVHERGFFRPPRPGAGQVRDAQARQGRWPSNSRCGPGIRSIASDVLQSTSGLRSWGSEWTTSSDARPTSGPQIVRAGHGVRRGRACRKRVAASTGSCTACQGTFRCARAPSEHRSGVGAKAKKKRVTVTEEKTLGPSGTDVSILTKLYEELRSWVVDPVCEPRTGPCRLGWGVLVSRGMREWMSACMSLSDGIDHGVAPPLNEAKPLPVSHHGQLVVAMANVLAGHLEGGTT